jgi:hypothetical protein
MIVYCGVFSLGVVGPKRQYSGNIFLFFRLSPNSKRETTIHIQVPSKCRVFSLLPITMQPSNTSIWCTSPNVQFD